MRTVVLAAALAAFCLAPAAPAADLPPGFPHDIQLPAKARGEDAITALGGRLPEVAAFYRKTPAELRALLRSDKCLWVNPQGRLYYVCEWPHPPEGEEGVTGQTFGPTDPPPFPPEMAFRLHSRPGVGKVIYLDFDGHDASATSWGGEAIARPFDTDGNPHFFSTAERERIIGIWQRVAEDFAMYDVNVTTEFPGTDALINSGGGDTNFGIRVVIGGSSGDWYGSAGGVAYVGSFNWNSDTPTWVFPKSLSDSEKNIAEATSHEVGHTLGLSHDGTTTGSEYYSGHGNWAPIMGTGYSRPIVQWSRGEYANANRTNQDDLAVMPTYGTPFRADDHGNSIAAATPLNGVFFATNGIISTRTDLDFFSFTTGAGRVTLKVNRPPRDSNLRLEVKLYNAFGTLLQTTNVADTTAGTQPVTLIADLAAGTYAFSVDGIGAGNPLTDGYSDYASLGQYLITGVLPNDSLWLPAGAGTYAALAPANWATNTVPNGIGATLRFNNNITGNQTVSFTTPVTVGGLFLGDAVATHSFTLENGGGGSLTFQALSNQPAALIKTTGLADTLALPVILASDLVLTNTTGQPLTFSDNLSGAGTLRKAGAGTVVMEGNATHTGGSVIAAGTLALGAAATHAGNLDLRAAGTLDVTALAGGLTLVSNQLLLGDGVVQGNLAAAGGAMLQPGPAGAAGALTIEGNLVLGDGSRLTFDLAANTNVGGGINDVLLVNGDLALDGLVSVTFNFLTNGPASPGTYTLIAYTGTLTGGAANLAAVAQTNRYNYTFDDSVPGELRVHVSGTPATLVWSGAGNQWDAALNTNWLAGATPEQFQQLDPVVFDATGATQPLVSLFGVLQPASVTFNDDFSYGLAGDGSLVGGMSLIKNGSGIVTLSTSNSFTGPVQINAGTLRLNAVNALGSPSAGTIVAAGAVLDLNARSVGEEPLTLAGAGPLGAGAVINSSATAQTNAVRFATLAGPTTLGGTGRWDIRAQPTGSLTGNNFSLTKTGSNEIRLADLGDTGLGEITIAQGTLAIQDTTTLGNANSNLTVQAGATLALWNTDNNTLNKRLILNGGTVRNEAGNNLFSGPVTLNTNATYFVADALQITGVIGGAAGLTKTGLGTLSLTAANTFTGLVTVSAGTLRAGNNTAFGRTNNGLIIASGARLDLAGFNLGAEPVSVTGPGLGTGGAIVNYGGTQTNALRFVTLTGNTTFGGISRWDLRDGTLAGNNFTLTKRGPNEVRLANLGNTGLGAISIAKGTLGVEGNTILGAASSNLTVSSGAALSFHSTGTNAVNKVASLSSGRLLNVTGTNRFAGPVAFSGSNVVDVATGTQLELSGLLTGSGTIYKSGTGTLVMSTNNTRTGPTALQAGVLQVGAGGPAGSPGQGNITNNAALVFNHTHELTLNSQILGTGSLTKLGSGTLVLNGASSFTGPVTLNALNAGILRLRNNLALGDGSKVINLRSGGSPNTAGSFGVELENNITLGTNLTWNISNDGLANPPFLPALRNRSGNNTIAGPVLIQTGGGGARFASDAGTLTLAGFVTTDVNGGRDLILDGPATGVFSGVISNGASANHFVNVLKEGAGTWTFSGTNHSGGFTRVRAGTLLLTGALGTNSLVVSNGATLRGTGLVRGAAVIDGTLAPGAVAAPGTLTCNGPLTLAGVSQFRLVKTPAPGGDRVNVGGLLTLGGDLTVTFSGDPLAAGDTFILFTAPAISGAFANVTLPPLPPGLKWVNNLDVNGTLTVAPLDPPAFTGIALVNGELQFSLLSVAGANYILEQATNLEPPILWLPLSTNLGDGNPLLFTVPLPADAEQGFFRLNAY